MTDEMRAEAHAAGRALDGSSSPRLRNVSVEERRRLVAASLQVGNPGNHAGELPAQADPIMECQIELDVGDIRAYEGNPRRAANARFAEIKESIRAGGVRNPLTVTRRPGETHFIVETGGNTRLAAVRQLWAETRDPRFRKLTVLFRPWRSESHVLTSHLIENEERAEMTFWDRAGGIASLKTRLEAEQGRVLSLRQLEEELRRLGLSVNSTTLGHFLYALERLRTLGDAVPQLSGLDVKTIQPRLNALKRHAQSRASLSEEDLYATVFEPAFRRVVAERSEAASFSAAMVCEACEEALATHFGEPIGELRRNLDTSVPPLPQSSRVLARTEGKGGRDSATGDESNGSPADGVDPGRSARDGHRGAPLERGRIEPASSRLLSLVQQFAAATGIGACVRVDEAAPLGFGVNALAENDAEAPDRKRAWVLLVGLVTEPGALGEKCALDAGRIGWLTDPRDTTAGAFWDVLVEARRVREERANSIASSDPPEAMGRR